MWQRIQTVFLVIAIISLIASLFFPVWTFQDSAGETHKLYPMNYTMTKNSVDNTVYFPYTITAILAIAAITLAIVEIGKFRDRVLQMKLGALNSLFMAGTVASAVIFSNQFVNTFQGGNYGLALWLPGLSVVCNLLANRYIRKDEKFVRESDRLR